MRCPLCAKSRHQITLSDHLVGAGTQRWRHGKAKRFSGLEIDYQFVLGWRLYRHVGRFFALEDAIDVVSRAPKLVNEIRPIRNQSAGGNIIAFLVDCGQLVLGGKSDDQITMYLRQRACRRDQTTIGGLREGCNFALYLPRRLG